MTPEEIKKRIDELVTLEIKPLTFSELKDAMKSEIGEDGEVIPNIADELVKDGCNTTHPGQIRSVNYAEVTCPDCNNSCKNRQVDIKIYKDSAKPHTRRFCNTCQHGQNPWTREYNLPKTIFMRAWNYWVKESDTGISHADSFFSQYKKKTNK